MPNLTNTKHLFKKTWTVLASLAVMSMLLSGCGALAPKKVYKVGILAGIKPFAPIADSFKAKMTELGYEEGTEITYDVQITDPSQEVYKTVTAKFVADGVDIIFAFPTEAVQVAMAATKGTNIPVVFAVTFTDTGGIVNSIREPGGNITGSRAGGAELASKRMDILVELVPTAKTIFMAYRKGYSTVPSQLEALKPQAAGKGITLIDYAASTTEDLQAKLDSYVTADGVGFDAILMLAEPLGTTPSFYAVLGKFSYDHNIPIGGTLINIDGKYSSIFGLTPNLKGSGEQVAIQVDKIFKGTPAGTIPVVTAETFFQLNYKAAQEFGLTVPDGLLSQADQVIR